MVRVFLAGLFFLGLSSMSLRAQVPLVDDDFETEDPCLGASGWLCYDYTRWVAPDADACPRFEDDPLVDPDHSVDLGTANTLVFARGK